MPCCAKRLSRSVGRAWPLALALWLVACGGGGSPPPKSPDVGLGNPSSGANVMSVYVDEGPTGNEVNRLYTDVRICQPGSATACQTIDHVLVDTGSTGLRLLASALNLGLAQTRVSTSAGTPLLNCAQFLDGSYAFGSVAKIDLQLGGQTLTGLPIQIMGDSSFAALAGGCSGGGQYSAMNSASDLGANGIIGISYFAQDCGNACAPAGTGSRRSHNNFNGYYYTCTSSACTSVTGSTASLSDQLSNPVARMSANNNGFVVNLPAVSQPGAGTLKGGEIIFGIGTQSNNGFGSGKVLTTDSWGYLSTRANSLQPGWTYTDSFIDTGSNGIFFDAGIRTCTTASGFYCPPNNVGVSASLIGANNATATIDFTVANAETLFAQSNDAAIPGLAGAISDNPGSNPSATFDWGLPFYFGRKVFQGLEGQSMPLGAQTYTGPFMAF